MKILDLTNLENSEIRYKISKFPDGQQNCNITSISIDQISALKQKPTYITYSNWKIPKKVQIKSRLNNFKDLEIIIATIACLKNLGVKEIHLYTPYIVGARSDRQFEEGGNHYLKQVICPIINSLNLSSITCYDPHSHVLEALLSNFKKISNAKLIEFAIRDILVNNTESHIVDLMYIAPDSGAFHKIYKSLEEAKIEELSNIIICSKERNTDGKLTKTVVPNLDILTNDKDIVIIDDICDGGRTFINIVDYIMKANPLYKGKKYLIVTHGIFSAGFHELNKYFDDIYCTNSYSDIGDYITISGELQKTNLNQLNVF